MSYTNCDMIPKSEKANMAKSLPFPKPGDEVVISGIAGRFPESDNLRELKENLFNKRDLITDDDRRWKSGYLGIPHETGKVNNIDKFDSRFFGVPFDHAEAMDPLSRMLLEHAYEAILDAGENPRQLRGTNTGVFTSIDISESERTLLYGTSQVGGSGVLGCSRSMTANRISHWLGTTGPSYNVDTACSSSLYAMDHAYRAIRTGQCDAALIGAANLCLDPLLSWHFWKLGILAPKGGSKSFDVDGDGYCRGEAVCAIYLRKAKDAKRVYANIIYTKTNCDGFKEQGISFPSSIMQAVLLQQFYKECGVPPTSLAYVEAHGTGTKVGDPEEINAIDKVLCHNRTTPLRIGSVKSNLGHTESASGTCAISKVVFAMETGLIPPNLHYNHPREGCDALLNGRMHVITEPTPWEGGYAGINSFGFGGANAHILLRSNSKEKINNGAPNDDLPRLVVVSGRTRKAVTALLDDLESRPVDAEYVSLFHNIHAEEIPGHLYRGYTILPPRSFQEKIVRDVRHYPGAKRPVCFVFSGTGTLSTGIGKALMKLPTFVEATQKCNAALKSHGIDVTDIFTTKDPNVHKNILNSFVGIAVLQIGLMDVLASIGIVPDHIIGNSIGELGCAYADGCLTAEQVVLAAYYQGLALVENKTTPESMKSVGLRKDKPKSSRPHDTKVARENGLRNSAISRPSDSMGKLPTKLQTNGIFPKNGRDFETAGQKLLTYLRKVIPDPRPRSHKWLSGSSSSEKSKTSSARLFSPEYYADCLNRPVSFEEMIRVTPNGSIAVEIAPHGLLQTISRTSSNENVTSIASVNPENEDPMKVLLRAVGRMYEVGLHPQLANLYPDVQYPVSRGTPMISPLIHWEHSDNWLVPGQTAHQKIDSGERNVEITLSEETFEWMAGYVIDGRNLVPATGYLVLVWETVALMQGQDYNEVPIVFEDVRFHRAIAIPKQGSVQLLIMVHKGSGRFEVALGETAVVTGFVCTNSNLAKENVAMLTDDDKPLDLTARDIYKELHLRGYHYAGLFRGLKRASLSGTKGSIAWKDNWVVFMDNMLQLGVLGMDTRGLYIPMGIKKLVIDPTVHSSQLQATSNADEELTVNYHKDLRIITSGGIKIHGVTSNPIPKKKLAAVPVSEVVAFVGYRDREKMNLKVITRIAMHIAIENHLGVNVKTIELIDDGDNSSPENLTSFLIHKILNDFPLIQANVNIIAPVGTFAADELPSAIHVFEPNKLAVESDALLSIGRGLLASKNSKTLKQLQKTLRSTGFLLTREPLNADADIFSTIKRENLDVIMEKRTNDEMIFLLRQRPKLYDMGTVIRIDNRELTWLPKLQAAIKAEREKGKRMSRRILLVGEGDLENGLMGLVTSLRKEPGCQVIQALIIQDLEAPKFSLENSLYSEQLDLGLAFNVLRPGKLWGTYRFLAMDSLPIRPVHHVRISQLVHGDLSSLKWVEGEILPSMRHRDIIEVHYSSLNFRDIMVSTGKIAIEACAKTRRGEKNIIGIEYSGKDINGRPVMGMRLGGACSNLCVCDSEFLWPVPDNWTLEDAATVPLVYLTAYCALVIKGKMRKGDKVLIHAGSGGVGQAAITLALHEGCEVFTTVGTPDKRRFIRSQFPQIDEDHIGSSRDTSFEQLIFNKTQGQGVDIVLNSLAEEKLQASIRCLAKGGRFLEIGKVDVVANNPLGMEVFLKGVTFHAILLGSLFNTTSERKTKLAAMLAEGLKSGAVKPLVRTVFNMDQVEMAFRYMAAGKHIGKVILKIRDGNEAREFTLPRAIPRYYCPEDASILILGGLGGFGLELADWLVLRGAKKLVFTSRSGITTGYQRLRINIWKSYGVEVVIVVGKDASTQEGCEYILKAAAELGPVDAIFNLAVVIKDALIENQTIESFEESFRVKAWATKQLDKLSRTLCPHLRHFVIFSSVTSGRGIAGQTNYGMANNIMERICETRRAENLPGLSIAWGAIADVGLVADLQEVSEKEILIEGTIPQKIVSCLQELDIFLQQSSTLVSSLVVAEKTAGAQGAATILEAVMRILGLKSLKFISLHTSLTEFGMDSMMVVEIIHTLERDFEVFLTAKEIQSLNFIEVEKLSLKQAGEAESGEKVTNTTDDLIGFELLIKTLGTGQISKDICVPLVKGAENEKREVFILPGIEGTHTVFESLAKKLKYATTCLQLETTSTATTSIGDMAANLIPHVRARSKNRKDFVIAGYSFGSLVAIELVRRLESEGLTGRLVLLDGSPEYVKAAINARLNTNSDDELQFSLLLALMDMLAAHVGTKLAEDLHNCNTWEERVAAFARNLPENESLNLTPKDWFATCSSLYHRLKAVQAYDSSILPQLRTPIILLRPKMQSLSSLSEDYGLKSITEAKVEVHFVEGNHVTMLDDDMCAAAMNWELKEDAVHHSKS